MKSKSIFHHGILVVSPKKVILGLKDINHDLRTVFRSSIA